jgi:hypothetical protein
MGADSNLPSLSPLRGASSSQMHTTLSIDVSADVNNMKIATPPDSSVTPVVVVQSPHPPTPSSQKDVATLKEDKSTLQIHAYSRAGIIKPGTYSRSLLRSAQRSKSQGLGCAGCTAVHSLRIDHCHKHDCDKNGKGPHKRLRR